MEIYNCSPRLHRLIIKEKFSHLNDDSHLTFSFARLTSLIVEQMNVKIVQLESFLFSTPLLIYLKLLGDCEIFNGKRWKDFIQVNLTHLNQFEFDIICRKSVEQTRKKLNLLIESYQSSFWIEQKKWFVIIEFDNQESFKYRIASLPICRYSYEHDYRSDKVFLLTSDEICPTKNISQLNLQFESSLPKKSSAVEQFIFISGNQFLQILFNIFEKELI